MACRLCFGDSGGPCCSFGTDAPPRRDPFAKAVGDDAAAAAVSRHTGAVSAVGTRMPTARAEGHTQPLNSLRNHCVDTEGAPDEFIAYATAAVRHDLPQRLVRLHDEDPCCVPIFRDMYSGGDELAHAVGQTGGALACAKHVLERGNEILKNYANKPTEEFRMSMAYGKFEERSKQMRQVLRCVFQSNVAELSNLDSNSPSAKADKTPFKVLSIGGGSGNDAIGVISFLMEQNFLHPEAAQRTVSIPPQRMLQHKKKVTWAEKKAAKKAGTDIKSHGVRKPEPYSDFVSDAAVPMPAVAPLPASQHIRCHVLDIEEQWYPCVGETVQCSLRQFWGGAKSVNGLPFATIDWRVCDVTKPLQKSYPCIHSSFGDQAAGVSNTQAARQRDSNSIVATDCETSGAALVAVSYLFSIHAGPEHTQGYEVKVSSEFWAALIASNPDAWFVFVEGCVSRRTWSDLSDAFRLAGRALSAPTNIKGELPKRVVHPSKNRPYPIRDRDRHFCYFFSPPRGADGACSQAVETRTTQ